MTTQAFRPPWYLRNRHLQTLLGPLVTSVNQQPDNWQRLSLPDGDELDIAWFNDNQAPTLIIFHGLEGSYRSHYIQRVIRHMTSLGWAVAVPHFRGCGRQDNLKSYSYHSGVSHDADFIISSIKTSRSNEKLVAMGFSLGGNVLLKWLGENPKQSFIDKAMAVSVPLKLDVCANEIQKGFSRVYQRHLISSLLVKTKMKMSKDLPGPRLPLDIPLNKVKNFWQFDEWVTAPLNGFDSAQDYYDKVSSIKFVSNIETPTLLLQAIDDPFMNASVLPADDEVGGGLTIEATDFGGHVGFLDHLSLADRPCYLANRVAAHFAD
ncbi:MAG: hydrolase [Kangiellaceae bacterium]|nr:hydrolase [Kangiellaceae bacterium]